MRYTPLGLVLFVFLWGCAQPGVVQSEAEIHVQVREVLRAEPALILDVLREHPLEFVEILEEAILVKQEYERRQQELADLATPREPQIDPRRPMRGEANASITIVEYSDLLCPFCSSAAVTIKELMAERAGQVRLVFKHLPLNPVSRELAQAFEALALQNPEAAWELRDEVFSRQSEVRADHERFLTDFIQRVSQRVSVDPMRFAADRQSPEVAALVDKDMEEARRFGFFGTPMFLINGLPVRGAVPLKEFHRVLEMIESKSVVPTK